jgi:hypothetical protein
MLPDFPKLKAKLHQIWNLYAEQRRRQHMGIFNDIPSHRHYEGARWLMIRADGSISESGYSEASSTFTVHLDEAPNLTPQRVAQLIDKMAQDMADQVEKNIFKSLLSELGTNDRVTGANERVFDKELFLEAMDSIMITFDRQGNPHMPTVFVSPEIGDHVASQLTLWNEDPDLKRRFDQIIERKREEWRARESSRRLVD